MGNVVSKPSRREDSALQMDRQWTANLTSLALSSRRLEANLVIQYGFGKDIHRKFH